MALWFEFEMSPRAHVFGHVVPSWWLCLGEVVGPFEGGASLKEVSRSGWALGFYRPVPLPALSLFPGLSR